MKRTWASIFHGPFLDGSAGRYPAGVVEVVAFSAMPSDRDLLGYIKRARAEAQTICAAEGLPSPADSVQWVNSSGAEQKLVAGGMIDGLR